jgi:Zn-dependent protease
MDDLQIRRCRRSYGEIAAPRQPRRRRYGETVSERETVDERDEYAAQDWERLYESALAEDDERGYRPIHPEPAWRALLRRLWAPIAAAALALWKLKFVFTAIFKLKFFTTAASMFVSIGAYALIWGIPFAIGFVLLLFVHESGHALEAKRQGLNVSAPVFIPFLGAAILLKEQPQDVWREFKVAAAGPILGSVGALAVLGVYGLTGRDFWLALAFVGFFLNLFNLAPVWQLDGGRMISAIHPYLWIPGLVGLTALLWFFPSPILIIVVFLGALQAFGWWRNRGAPENTRYFAISRGKRTLAGVVYLGLVVALGVLTSVTFIEREL